MSEEPTEPAAGVATGRIYILGRVSHLRRWAVEQKPTILFNAFKSDEAVRPAVERLCRPGPRPRLLKSRSASRP
jgi:hypothetical protein